MAETTGRKLGFAAALLIGAVLLSRVLGFLREAFIAAVFGANGQTDAFIAAFTIPDWLNYILAGATLSITFIPIYARHLTDGSSEEGDRVFSIIATVMALVLVVAIVVVEWFAPELVSAYLVHLAPANRVLAVQLTRILLPAQLFFYLGGLVSATLFARHRFVAASLAPLIYNLGTIAGGVLGGRTMGIASMAWGTLAGAIVGPFAIQALAARRAGLRYSPSLRVTHPEFREWLLATLPLMVGVSVVTADDWIIRYFAAGDVGAISCLNYARKLVMVPIAVAGQAVGQASMPFFARLYAEGKSRELGQLVGRSARASGQVAALAAAGMIALAWPLVDLLFRRGQFSSAQVGPTALYLSLFAVAIPLWGIQGIIARAFYAARDTLTPMVAGSAITLAALPIYWIAFRAGGVSGLVVASGTAILMHTGVLLLLLPRRVPDCDRRALLVGLGRAALLGLAAGAPAWMAERWLPNFHLLGHAAALYRVAVGGCIFVGIAVLLARPLGVDDAADFLDRLYAKIVKRKSRG